MRNKPRPLAFLVDGRPREHGDTLTARFPRSARQAFGHYTGVEPLPNRLSFHPHRYGTIGPALAFVAVLLIVCAIVAD